MPVLCPEEGLTKFFCRIPEMETSKLPILIFHNLYSSKLCLNIKWTLSVFPALLYSLHYGEEMVPTLLRATFCIFECHCHALWLSYNFFSCTFRLHSTSLSSISLRGMFCITIKSTQKWKEDCFSPFLHDDISRIKQANSVILEFPCGYLYLKLADSSPKQECTFRCMHFCVHCNPQFNK